MNISLFQLLIILSPLLIPAVKRKWAWFGITGLGYILYILWGIYLHFTADITEYGTGYGLMIVPWIIACSFVGYYVQKTQLKSKKPQ